MQVTTPASTPVQTLPSSSELLELLRESSLLIAMFRRRLREAGYPFAEPPNTSGIIAGIDAVCFPDEPRERKRKNAAHAGAVT